MSAPLDGSSKLYNENESGSASNMKGAMKNDFESNFWFYEVRNLKNSKAFKTSWCLPIQVTLSATHVHYKWLTECVICTGIGFFV